MQPSWLNLGLCCLSPALFAAASAMASVLPGESADRLAQTRVRDIAITEIRVESVEAGIELIVETDAVLTAYDTRTLGNAVAIDIPNVTLSEPFQSFDPAEGIALIDVAETTDGVRISVTGTDAPPAIVTTETDTSLTLGIAPGVATVDGSDDDALSLSITGEDDTIATTATRTDTPINEVPQSIQVIPQEIIEEQQAFRLDEVLRNSPGVIQGNTFGNTDEVFTIRGFEQSTILRDGFRTGTIVSSFRETANIDRVEVLKGPAAILFGNVEPGGVVNLVTERPQREFGLETAMQVGGYGLYRPTVDITGPFTTDGDVRYRFNAAYESSDGYRDFDTDVERYFIAPVIAFDIGDRTEVTLELEYLDDRRPFDRGILPVGDEIADIDTDTILGEPGDFAEVTQLSLGYRLEHQLSQNWELRNRFRYVHNNFLSYRAEALRVLQPNGDFSRAFVSNDSEATTYDLQTEVQGEFTTGSIEHTLLVAVDLFSAESETLTTNAVATPQNLFDPTIGEVERPSLPLNIRRADFNSELRRLGLVLQDRVELSPEWNLLLGGRVDFFEQEGQSAPLLGDGDGPVETQSETAFTPRLGVVYQPIEELSLYGSYSQSFQPNTLTSTTVDGDFLEPERGEQFEIGAKAELFDGRLSANLALFDITQTNVAESDPNNPGFVVPIGRQVSQGLELEVTGEILPGWNVLAGFSLLDSEIEESDAVAEGGDIRNVPDTSANLWTTYEIQSGDLAGLGFGLGLFFVGDRAGDAANTFTLDDYLRTDAAIFYRRDNLRLGLNIRNLFDVDYYASSVDRRGAIPGDPFTVIGSVSVEF